MVGAKVFSEVIWPHSGRNVTRSCCLVVGGVLLVAIAAQIRVPLYSVPITLQSLAVLIIGISYGARLGATTLAFYAIAGAVGLPVFSGFNSGLLIPSFGYVIGFVAAAFVVGFLAQRRWDRSLPRMFIAILLGATLVYIPGLIWLSFWVGAEKVVQVGLLPFVMNDLIEAAAAAICIPIAWRLVGES